MRTLLLNVGVCAVALLGACEHADEGDADGAGDALRDERARKRTRAAAFDAAGGSSSRADATNGRRSTARSARSREAGGENRDDGGYEPEDAKRRSRDGRPPRRIAGDELVAALGARSLPDGVYEIDRSASGTTGLFSTQQELEEFLERLNVRVDWFQVIRVGPWTIRVVRDTFFDPYRRDSGWIDIDRLDGPHGR